MNFRVKVFDGGVSDGARRMLQDLVEAVSMYNVLAAVHEGCDEDGTDTWVVLTRDVPPAWAATARDHSKLTDEWVKGFVAGYCARWGDT